MTQQRTDYPLDYSKSAAQRTLDGSRTTAEAAAEQFDDVAKRAQDIAGQVADQARDYGEKAQAAVKEFKPFVEKSMREQPMTTLAGAAAIGFVLGALWKR